MRVIELEEYFLFCYKCNKDLLFFSMLIKASLLTSGSRGNCGGSKGGSPVT